jgi:hypothetical protein
MREKTGGKKSEKQASARGNRVAGGVLGVGGRLGYGIAIPYPGYRI